MMQLEQTLYKDTSQTIENRVANLLDQMTLAEKIGQMTQVEKNSIEPDDVTNYFIGSILSGGGGNPTPNTFKEWRKMVQAYMNASLKTRLSIPMIYGSDAVHGHSNVKGAVIFPHNVGLGATRDANLVERIAHATAIELLATNVHWDFAPAVSVPQDIRWGRSYEGFSENTDLVTELGLAYARGLQQRTASGEWILPSVKHFAADGGTEWDSRKDIPNYAPSNWQAASQDWRIDQGDARMDEETLRTVHLAPYKEAVDAGVDNIMVSFSSWNGLKMHAHEYLLTTVLKGEWGFEGFLVSDWMAIDQLKESFYDAVVTSINSGVDMVMVPFDYKTFINIMEQAVNKGDITVERIDDAVSRILRAKFKLGLFETPITSDAYLTQAGSEDHRALAREAVQKSAVLLKNDDVLPIAKNANIVVAGDAADSIGLACGGWTIEWQGGTGAITDGSTLLEGLNSLAEDSVQFSSDGKFSGEAEIGIVVIAEDPYAEGEGDCEDLTITAEQTQLIEAMRERCAKLILVMYSGRPIIITHVADDCDAIVAAWLPGSEANALADVLYGDVPFTGKLAFTWYASMDQLPLSHYKASDKSALWDFGHGL